MKKIFFFFAFIAMAFPQENPNGYTKMNPDGYIGGWSFHLTPMGYYGTGEYFAGGSEPIAKVDYPFSLGFDVKIVYPANETISWSFFYRRTPQDSKFTIQDITGYNETLKGGISTVGATLSIYIK
jgi:hypothetical protein